MEKIKPFKPEKVEDEKSLGWNKFLKLFDAALLGAFIGMGAAYGSHAAGRNTFDKRI